MTRCLIAAATLALLAVPSARAQDEASTSPPAPTTASSAIVLTLESAGDIERKVVTYQCDNAESLAVHYLNAAPNFLAILPVDGASHVFVTTVSGSGARYVAGPFEWWTKGEEATLRDLMQDEDAPPMATCLAASNTP
ncbi:MAG: hypothetical protein ABS75_14215 [Pelagibacterium sp. SCN 63-23]|nr:MAG: hypothetical protein ABS75_14215 [Pelagibacterium sp. SCN 63-23]